MSEADPPRPADTIDEGRRLVRAGGDKGLSLAERLGERLHALAWRTPFHAVRLKGRYPLKLLAVPDDPVPGDVARGQALIAGEARFGGAAVALDALDFASLEGPPALLHYLHSFEWLRDLAAAAPRQTVAPIAEAITARWLAAHADTMAGLAWVPELWGRRLQQWTAHAPLILSSSDVIYRSRVLNALARGARHLDRSADKAAPGSARLAAWAGVLTAGLLIPGGEPRRQFGETGMARALAAGVFADGGAVSRSPAVLLDGIAILAMLARAYDVRRIDPPEAMTAALAKMVPALLGVGLGDRGLGSWQGGLPLAEPAVQAVVAATGLRTRPLRQSNDWGYQRLSAGGAVVVMDAAPPPIARVVDGGCASTLAFELSDGPTRLVVNCGGGQAPGLDPALARGLRTTAAHSTLVVADTNSTAILADGTLGRGVAAVDLSRQESEAASRIEASHDGYRRRFGLTHRRLLQLSGDGRELRGEDALLPAGRTKRVAATGFALRFHLGPGVSAAATADGQGAILRLPDGALWQFRCRDGTLTVEPSLWIDGDGRTVATQQLVVGGEAPAGGASVGWAFKRAR